MTRPREYRDRDRESLSAIAGEPSQPKAASEEVRTPASLGWTGERPGAGRGVTPRCDAAVGGPNAGSQA
jgi:hypothetical protein